MQSVVPVSLRHAVHAQCNIEFNVHRYSASQPQRGLHLHRDHSHVSFNVALNHLSEYVHGGDRVKHAHHFLTRFLWEFVVLHFRQSAVHVWHPHAHTYLKFVCAHVRYQGGGTHIPILGNTQDTTLRIGRGDMLMHSSGLVHEGVNVTEGTRYILVSGTM